MRLVRVGAPGRERPGVLVDDEHYVDVGDLVPDLTGDHLAPSALDRLAHRAAGRAALGRVTALAGQRLGPPVARPHQILCVGLNYAEHAAESRMDIPGEPVVFTKAPNSLSGPRDPVLMPVGGTKLDYEVELGVVIGSRCRYLPDRDAALAAVAGYVLVNDVSERAFQLERSGQWVKGKSCETFNPCGPYLVTPQDAGDTGGLSLWLDVNGERRQDGSTAMMIFDVAAIILHLSRFMVLEPGDLVNTGTPPGVALGMAAPRYLEVGDTLELGATGLGLQRYRVEQATA